MWACLTQCDFLRTLNSLPSTGVSYFEAKSVSGGRAFFVAGRCDDQCVRQDGRRRFARMDFTPYFTVPFEEGWAQEDLLQMGRREGS